VALLGGVPGTRAAAAIVPLEAPITELSETSRSFYLRYSILILKQKIGSE